MDPGSAAHRFGCASIRGTSTNPVSSKNPPPARVAAADLVEQLQAVLAHSCVVVVDLDLVEERIDRGRNSPSRSSRLANLLATAAVAPLTDDGFRQRLLLTREYNAVSGSLLAWSFFFRA